MAFNLLSRFILWFKKIFHIRPKMRYEKEELLVEVLPEKKTEIISEPEERPPEIPSEEKTVEAKPPERKTLEVLPEKKTQKPYKKKAPTEERKKDRKKPSEDYEKPAIPERRKEIDLGAKRKKPKPTKQLQQAAEVSTKKTEKDFGRKETLTKIEAPFIEVDLDDAKVFLIILIPMGMSM